MIRLFAYVCYQSAPRGQAPVATRSMPQKVKSCWFSAVSRSPIAVRRRRRSDRPFGPVSKLVIIAINLRRTHLHSNLLAAGCPRVVAQGPIMGSQFKLNSC